MSNQLIDRYYNKLQKIIQYGGSENESSIRDAFKELLSYYADKKNLMLIPEIRVKGTKGEMVQPDGTLKNALRLDYGYWESKDSKDDIDSEINNKIKKGYPLTNILFEDSQTAVLFQHGEVTHRVDMRIREKLDEILNAFVSYEHPEIYEFHKALEQFKGDLPHILDALRELIEKEGKENQEYIKAKDEFLENCRLEINPDFTKDDVREMVIQHILTEEIFNAVFDESHFHMENNIARKLDALAKTFFTGDKRRNTLDSIKHYYNVISATAKNIADHHEKQKFLKVIYENFYKSYNPKAADRLGVVYTPNEIVNFMIESTDYLLDKHFNKTLADKNVEILDPATGTGTFICDLIEHIPKEKLQYKYKYEIHANEVAILPYYVANLNIEYTYKQKMEYYSEFPNLCFVDTLDNTDALLYAGKQEILFGLSNENAERIKRQNKKKISVIIGNPPYNANQKNENENNKNREYPAIDKRIKETFVAYSSAQKTKVYDMYARFYRWSMDRIDKNGIIALVTNRSFINSKTFDGFRKSIEDNFNYCYIIDTRSDVRLNPRIAGTTHNVFGIQTGVAITFLIQKDSSENEKCKIQYYEMDENLRKEEKLQWLSNNFLSKIKFKEIKPDKNHSWINISDTDFEDLIPVISKKVKYSNLNTSFAKIYSTGISTNRDEWIVDFSHNSLSEKIVYFINKYEKNVKGSEIFDSKIKWSRNLKNRFRKELKEPYNLNRIIRYNYRPFIKKFIYYSEVFIDEHGLSEVFFKKKNIAIALSGSSSSKPFQCLAVDTFLSLDFLEKTQFFGLYRYENGTKIENITDWGLMQFQNHYKDKIITKENIFHYVYSILNNPNYKKKYELNLNREYPKIPFYSDFWKWSTWGKELMDLHINYEDAEPYNLLRKDDKPKVKVEKQKQFFPKVKEPEPMFGVQPKIKVKLKADKENGKIYIDEVTTLSRVPKSAWEYKLGNRSAVEWILDQYKERKQKDKTIAEKFNNYHFADYKEEVIELIKKVCTVSIKTMEIIKQMEMEKE